MKVYILKDAKDPHGLLTAVIRVLKWLPVKPEIYLAGRELKEAVLYEEVKIDTPFRSAWNSGILGSKKPVDS